MWRHDVDDVNIACSPWRCAVPLVGVDLDVPAAVAAFDAEHQGGSEASGRVRGEGWRSARLRRWAGVPARRAPTRGAAGTGPRTGRPDGSPPSLVDGRRDYHRPGWR